MHDALTPWSFGTLMAMTTKVSSLMADGANRILELLAKLAQHGFRLKCRAGHFPEARVGNFLHRLGVVPEER